MKLDGAKTQEIMDYLNRVGITSSKGNPFTTGNQIINIFKNKAYIGKMTYGKTYTKVVNNEKERIENNGSKPMYIISNHYVPIIVEDTFYQIQEIFTTNLSVKQRTPYTKNDY